MSFLTSSSLALLSGLLAALSFPTIVEGVHFPNLSWLAWIALLPYLLTLRNKGLWQVAGLTFLFSQAWNALTSYWIFNALYFNANFAWWSSLAILFLMSTLLATLQSAFMVLCMVLIRRFRISWLVVIPVLWSVYEWVRNYWPFGGYPWANLGYSQAGWIQLIQVAELFGVYGVTFVVVLVNCVALELLLAWRERRPLPWRATAVAAAVVLIFSGYGFIRLHQVEATLKKSESIRVGLIQPDVGQKIKWQKDRARHIVNHLTQMTKQAIKEGAELVIWPEASYPQSLPLQFVGSKPLSLFRVPIIVGALSSASFKGHTQPILYNSAVQVQPGGRFAGRQHKQHMVPLGEYVPLQKYLWFMRAAVPKMGDFRSRPPEKLLEVYGYPYGVTICYEDLFPEISRDYTGMGAQFLVNITNDAWYRDSSQLDQHLNFSRFRAIENRRSIVRATNNGYTAAIDPTGRIRAELPKFVDDTLITDISIETSLSLYTRAGDFLWLTLLAMILGVAWVRARRT